MKNYSQSHRCPTCGQKIAQTRKEIIADAIAAAKILRRDKYSYYAIAKELGITSRTVLNWRDKGLLD